MRQPQLNGIEHGRYGLTKPVTLIRLAKGLECLVDDLLIGIDDAYDELLQSRGFDVMREPGRRRGPRKPPK